MAKNYPSSEIIHKKTKPKNFLLLQTRRLAASFEGLEGSLE